MLSIFYSKYFATVFQWKPCESSKGEQEILKKFLLFVLHKCFAHLVVLNPNYCKVFSFESQTPHEYRRKLLLASLIGHFRAVLCLCIKTSPCETIRTEMSSAYRFILMQTKLIFIWEVLQKDSLWYRGVRELGNGLFQRESFGRFVLPCKKWSISTASPSGEYKSSHAENCHQPWHY